MRSRTNVLFSIWFAFVSREGYSEFRWKSTIQYHQVIQTFKKIYIVWQRMRCWDKLNHTVSCLAFVFRYTYSNNCSWLMSTQQSKRSVYFEHIHTQPRTHQDALKHSPELLGRFITNCRWEREEREWGNEAENVRERCPHIRPFVCSFVYIWATQKPSKTETRGENERINIYKWNVHIMYILFFVMKYILWFPLTYI